MLSCYSTRSPLLINTSRQWNGTLVWFQAFSSSSRAASMESSFLSGNHRRPIRTRRPSSGPVPIGTLKDKYGRLILRRVRIISSPRSADAVPRGRHVSAAPHMETLHIPRFNLLDATHLHVRFPGGIYLRIPRKLPKIPVAGPAIVPKPLVKNTPSPVPLSHTGTHSTPTSSMAATHIPHRNPVLTWFRENIPTLILNIGSLATLTAFTRSDILELRMLSITGSLSSILYFSSRPPPRIYAPMIWSSIFVLTNSYMLYKIYIERKGSFNESISLEELHAYQEFFYPYGVTPRQFGLLLSKAKKTLHPKGSIVQSPHVPYQKVFLVLSGKTEARVVVSSTNNSTLTRRITAASSVTGNKKTLMGGDAGAWIGEEAFLEEWSVRSSSVSPPVLTKHWVKKFQEEEDKVPETKVSSNTTNYKTPTSLLEYRAVEDSIVLEWTHDDLFELLSSASSDFRGAIPRAMTGAVVGKVVNMYSSSSNNASSTLG